MKVNFKIIISTLLLVTFAAFAEELFRVYILNNKSFLELQDWEQLIRIHLFIFFLILGIFFGFNYEYKKNKLEIISSSEEKFRALFEESPLSSQIIDFDAKVLEVNSAWSENLGYVKNEIIGKDFFEIISKDSKEKVKMELREIQSAGQAQCKDIALIKRNNEILFVDIKAKTFKDLSGKQRIHCILVDVTERNRESAEIKQKFEWFEGIFRNSPVIMASIQLMGTIKNTNKLFNEISGLSKDQIIGKEFTDFLDENSKIIFTQKVLPLIEKNKKVQNIELTLELSEKNLINVNVNFAGLLHPSGERIILAVMHDITEKLRIEKILAASEDKFRKAFHTNPDSININRLSDGKYIDVNEGFYRQTGYEQEEVVGKTSLEIDIWHDYNDRSRLIELLKENGYVRDFEAVFRMKNGTLLHGLMSASIINIDNEPCIISLTKDITNIKKIENALQQSEQTVKTILEAAPIGIGMVTNRVLGWTNNRLRELLGYSESDLYGKSARILYETDEEFLRIGKEKHEEMRLKGIGTIETKFVSKNHDSIDILLSSSPIDPKDESKGIIFTVMDISIRKKAQEKLEKFNLELEASVKQRTAQLEDLLEDLQYENNERKKIQDQLEKLNIELENSKQSISGEASKLSMLNDKLLDSRNELKQANAAKDKFLSIIAHDLKNPLQSLLLASDLLYRYKKDYDKEKLEKKHKQIYDSSRQIAELLENLLQWARSQTSSIKFMPKVVSVENIISDSLSYCKGYADKKEIKIDTNINSELNVVADKDMLSTIMRNLISNAVKFTPINGNITIETKENGSDCVISVIDNGIGMDEDTLADLFRIDVHHSNPGTENEKGTGLGLIICKEFAEKNGGTILVESNKSEGSKFSLTLPMYMD